MSNLINSYSLSSVIGIGTDTPNKNLTVVGGISSNDTIYDVSNNSKQWTTAYTYLTGNSASLATQSYVGANFLPLSGGTLTGFTAFLTGAQIYGNLTVNGNLTATGTTTFANTKFTTTSALSVVNAGVGPALFVQQANGPYDIASFYDSGGVEVMHIGNIDPITSLGKVGINISSPNNALTVGGSISATGNFNTNGYLSAYGANFTNPGIVPTNFQAVNIAGAGTLSVFQQLQNTYSGVSASADISIYNDISNYLDIGINSSGYNGNSYPGVFNVVQPNDGYVYNAGTGNLVVGTANSSDFLVFTGGTLSGASTQGGNERLRINSSGNIGIGTSTPNQVLTVVGNISSNNVFVTGGNSNQWNTAYSIATAYQNVSGTFLTSLPNSLSSNWQTTYTTVTANSSNWNTAYTLATGLTSISSSWVTYSNLNTGTFVPYSAINTLTGNWNTAYASTTALNLSSSSWNSTYTTVQNNSATTWNYQGTDLKGLSGNWQSTYGTVSSLSASWSTAYTWVSSNSANATFSTISAAALSTTNIFSYGNETVLSDGVGNDDLGNGANTLSLNFAAGVYIGGSGSLTLSAVNGTVGTFSTSVSAPALSGVHYGDGSKLTGITSGSTISSTLTSGWQSTYTTVTANSANWGTAYTVATTYQTASSTFLTSIPSSLSGNWQSTYTTVQNTSGNWNTAYQTVSTIPLTFISTTSATNTLVGANSATGIFSAVRGGQCNIASANYSTIVGGFSGCSAGYATFVGAGSGIRATGNYAVAVGGQCNTASGCYSFVGGGASGNLASGPYSVVVGGCRCNCATAAGSVVVGGDRNTACGACSFLGSGKLNTASGTYAFVGSGLSNVACGGNSVLGGGYQNCSCGTMSAIVGGRYNCTSSGYSFIGGGCYNTASGCLAVVTGGFRNTASGAYSFVAGGSANDTKGFANTFILGTGLSANQANYTYVNNLSVQGNISSNTIYTATAYLSANTTAIANNDLWLPLSVKNDPNNWISNAGSYPALSGKITPTIPGYYLVSYQIAWNGTTGTGQNNSQIRLNGTNTKSIVQMPLFTGSGGSQTQSQTAIVYLNGSSDSLNFSAYSSVSAQTIVGTTDGNWTRVDIHKIN